MWKQFFVYLSVVAALYGCDFRKKETAMLQGKVDSLRSELVTNSKSAEMLQEIGTLIDSIDMNRHVLRIRMLEGTTLQEFTSRMKDINNYVKKTEKRVSFLETRLSSTKTSNSSHTSMVRKLKHDLEIRNQELAALQEQVSKYHNEKEYLLMTVSLQKTEIADKLSQLKAKQQEITKLDSSVKELLAQSKIDEAESCFARALALEETANRTKFAPRKKRNTRKEALELYKLAVSFGKEEAKAKVTELEKKI